MKRTFWLIRRLLWSPVRTAVELTTGVAFYFYVALSLGVAGAFLSSSDRSANRIVQGAWFTLEIIRYAAAALLLWFVSAIYFTVLEREIFLTAWRDTYRPWLHGREAT